jgi:2-keto-4-pentenoate hydratase/2-oxohepta-3-ene-1,7-dioic acid hydratase in catechol pathway
MLDVQVVATTAGVGRVENGEIAVLDLPFPHAGALLEHTGSLAAAASCSVRKRLPLTDTQLLAPLGSPRALWGVGLNYHSKAMQTDRHLPTEPILYLAASSAVVAPGSAVRIPVERTVEMDYEGEIAVIIGRRLDRADPEDVWSAIAGVTAANDITARDVMRATAAPTLAKSFPGFNPLGASLVTPDELPDRDRVRVRTWVNGNLLQDDTSAGMIFPIPELVARLSWFAALQPGDVVLTGTPAGTGQDRACFLAAGDEIRVEVDSVLPLSTTVGGPLDLTQADAHLAEHAR